MKKAPSRTASAVVACLAVVLAGLVALTPAGASLQDQVGAAAQQNWSKVWRQKIRPRADRRYYTKAQAKDRFAEEDDVWTKAESDAKYATKTDTWTRAESDAKYATKADTWTRAESDAKYQTKPAVYRGNYVLSGVGAGALVMDALSYGVTLAAPPAAHYIRTGDPVPAGCSGTAAAPNAEPGHLCVFESTAFNMQPNRYVSNLAFATNTATQTGANIYGFVAAAGNGYFAGTWAMRPGGTATATSGAAAPRFSGLGAEVP
ncbi:hypothetical protein [Nocardioides solisilvae]|uniref:hypothetical protein n=1 Tax=Nocardioides solisilvae TaxID=1542435 RepID=UPI0013A540E7|nr:hypothetical protein [Nocardioides solisilvae]